MELVEGPKNLVIPQKRVKIGVAQYSSVNFNLEASLTRLEKIVEDAVSKGVQLLLFPEAFLSGYPHGGDLGAIFSNHSSAGRKIYQLWHESAVEVPGPVVTRLSKIAKEKQVFLVVGVIEKEPTSSTMYCTVVFVKEDGTYLGKHRKLVPTSCERLTWGRGDGSTMLVFDTLAGKVGAVTCWENYMPLMRTAMYTKGIQIYCAPNADCTDNWQHTMRHIALEGRCFVLGCNQFTRRSDYPPSIEFPNIINDKEGDRVLSRGGSVIVSPLGEVLAGPNFTSEELLIADIDLNEVIRGKYDLDVVGHYSRPDIFTLYVNEKPNPGLVTSFRKLKLTGAVEAKIGLGSDKDEKTVKDVYITWVPLFDNLTPLLEFLADYGEIKSKIIRLPLKDAPEGFSHVMSTTLVVKMVLNEIKPLPSHATIDFGEDIIEVKIEH